MKKGNQAWIEARVRYAFGRLSGYVCPHCKAHSSIMVEQCTAIEEEQCPAVIEIDRVLAEFDKDWER